LQKFRAFRPDASREQNHLTIFEFASEIEITTFVVDPGLLPLRVCVVEYGDADSAQRLRQGGEIFLDDAASMMRLMLLVPWPVSAAVAPGQVKSHSPTQNSSCFCSGKVHGFGGGV